MVGRPDGHSEQLFTLLARLAQILVIAIFAGWAVTRLRSDIGSLTVVVLVALLIGLGPLHLWSPTHDDRDDDGREKRG